MSKQEAWELIFCEQGKFHLCKKKSGAYAKLLNELQQQIPFLWSDLIITDFPNEGEGVIRGGTEHFLKEMSVWQLHPLPGDVQ